VRIGIDATAMPLQRTGAGNYIHHLVRGLARIDRANEYVVFVGSGHIERLAVDAANVCVVPRDFRNRVLRLAWEQLGLPGEVRAHRLDVLHSPHYTVPLRGGGAASVVTFHDFTFLLYPELHEPAKRVFFPAMMRQSARRATHLISDSNSTRTDLIQRWGIPGERITTVPLAAESRYQPARPQQVAEVCARYGVRPDGYLLYVGTLEPRKQVDRLVEAFALATPSLSGLELVVAGKRGWMYDRIFARVSALGLECRVRFPGYVPDEDLPALYGGATAFVYPSRYEGFGLPVLEAMSCGVPVITTDVSSMPEVAGDAALLVRPDSVDELAGALRRVAQDPALREELRAKGLRRAQAFSWDRCARETLAVYQLAHARRNGGSG
jgi:glycosyltransferase involved in cell wall biosynthesis